MSNQQSKIIMSYTKLAQVTPAPLGTTNSIKSNLFEQDDSTVEHEREDTDTLETEPASEGTDKYIFNVK